MLASGTNSPVSVNTNEVQLPLAALPFVPSDVAARVKSFSVTGPTEGAKFHRNVGAIDTVDSTSLVITTTTGDKVVWPSSDDGSEGKITIRLADGKEWTQPAACVACAATSVVPTDELLAAVDQFGNSLGLVCSGSGEGGDSAAGDTNSSEDVANTNGASDNGSGRRRLVWSPASSDADPSSLPCTAISAACSTPHPDICHLRCSHRESNQECRTRRGCHDLPTNVEIQSCRQECRADSAQQCREDCMQQTLGEVGADEYECDVSECADIAAKVNRLSLRGESCSESFDTLCVQLYRQNCEAAHCIRDSFPDIDEWVQCQEICESTASDICRPGKEACVRQASALPCEDIAAACATPDESICDLKCVNQDENREDSTTSCREDCMNQPALGDCNRSECDDAALEVNRLSLEGQQCTDTFDILCVQLYRQNCASAHCTRDSFPGVEERVGCQEICESRAADVCDRRREACERQRPALPCNCLAS